MFLACGLLGCHAPNDCVTVQFDKMHVSLKDMYAASEHKQAKSEASHVVVVSPVVTQVV
jgi:hypothetical protein